MKELQKIIKISAKEGFKILRKNGPYFCESLQKDIAVTSVFWNHIIFSKERNLREIQERMLIVNIIPRIFKEGVLQSQRDVFFRIILKIEYIHFIVIIQKTSTKFLLLSCFKQTQKK